METELKIKFEKLRKEIIKLDSAIIAFSGGIDSILLLKVVYDILGENVQWWYENSLIISQ